MNPISHYDVFEVIYFKRGYHCKRFTNFVKASRAFENIPSKFSPTMKKFSV